MSPIPEDDDLVPLPPDEDLVPENAPVQPTPSAPIEVNPKGAPSPVDSAVRGAGQGLTFGWDDEAMGALGAFDELAKRGATAAYDALGMKRRPEDVPVEDERLKLWEAVKARYGRERDVNRTEIKTAQSANPKAFLAGQLGGAFLSPNPTAKMGAMARLAGTAGAGALSSAGASEARTAGGLAADTAMGGAFGAAIGGAGLGLGAIGNKFGDLAAKIRADKLAKNVGELESAAASAAGVAGNATQRVLRTVEDAVDVLKNPSAPQSLKDAAQKVLGDPDVMAHYQQALANKFGNSTAAAAAAEAAKKAASEAATGIADKAAAATDDYFAKNTPLNELTRRLGPLATRAALGAAGGYLGGAAADALGVDKGLGMAGGFGAGFSAPGTLQALRNYAKSPAVQAGLASKMQGLMSFGSNVVAPTSAVVAGQQAGQQATQARNENAAALQELAKRYGIDIGPEEGAQLWFSKLGQ